MFQFKNCRHIMPSGLNCKSPAMRNSAFCYFHARAQRPSRPGRPRETRIEIPSVLDSAGICKTVTQVLQALGSGLITNRRAGTLLYALQMASGQKSSDRWNRDFTDQPATSADAPELPPELAAECDALFEKIASRMPRIVALPATK